MARTRLQTPAVLWYAATDLELPSLRMIRFSEDLTGSLRGRAGGACDFLLQRLPPVLFLDFVVSHTYCVPEDPASLFIDRLAGKWAI